MAQTPTIRAFYPAVKGRPAYCSGPINIADQVAVDMKCNLDDIYEMAIAAVISVQGSDKTNGHQPAEYADKMTELCRAAGYSNRCIPRAYSLGVRNEHKECSLLTERSDINNALCGACAAGNVALAMAMMAHHSANEILGFATACAHGQPETARLMISYGAKEWNSGLVNACNIGHLGLAREMIRRGASASMLTIGLRGAYRSGHLEFVREMLASGSAECPQCGLRNGRWGIDRIDSTVDVLRYAASKSDEDQARMNAVVQVTKCTCCEYDIVKYYAIGRDLS